MPTSTYKPTKQWRSFCDSRNPFHMFIAFVTPLRLTDTHHATTS